MLDHLLWGVPDLDEGVRDLERRGGVRAAFGGRHPGFGTHNALLDLEQGRYLEIIAPDPTQDRFSDFGRWLRGLREPALLTWAARAGDVEAVAAAVREAGLSPGEVTEMSRNRPGGDPLRGRLLEIGGHAWGPLMPFFIQFLSSAHPSSDAPRGCRLRSFALTHPAARELGETLAQLGLELELEEGAQPGLRAVVECPRGTLTLTGPPAGGVA